MTVLHMLLLALTTGGGQLDKATESQTLMVIGNHGDRVASVVAELVSELGHPWQILVYYGDQELDPSWLESLVDRRVLSAVVVLSTPGLEVYERLSRRNDLLPPAIIALVPDEDLRQRDLDHAVVIRDEVSVVIGVVHLRALLRGKLTRVGTIYRPGSEQRLRRQIRQCEAEGIELEAVVVGDDLEASLDHGLRRMIEGLGVDAIWVPNDTVLTSKSLIERVWRPRLAGFSKPVIVGSSKFFHEKFGNFAIFPDHRGVGLQISELAREFAAHPSSFQGGDFLEPISVNKCLHLGFARRHLDLRESVLDELDVLYE